MKDWSRKQGQRKRKNRTVCVNTRSGLRRHKRAGMKRPGGRLQGLGCLGAKEGVLELCEGGGEEWDSGAQGERLAVVEGLGEGRVLLDEVLPWRPLSGQILMGQAPTWSRHAGIVAS